MVTSEFSFKSTAEITVPKKIIEQVIGQDEAVQLVADAVIRARAGIKDPQRPIG